MENCQICGAEMKVIPAGVSRKTGKSYNSFTACPEGHQQPRGVVTKPTSQQSAKQPDWDNIALGKVRHGVITAMIQANWEIDRAAQEMDAWVDLIMKGQKPF